MLLQQSDKLIVLLLQLALAAAFNVDVPLPGLVQSTRPFSTILSQTTTSELVKTTDDATLDLPPLLKEISDQRREYEMNLGRAMDVLRQDYPYILVSSLDYSIYDDNIIVTNPSGVIIEGISSYKKSISFLQKILAIFYNTDRSRVQMRSFYDLARNSLRISFHVQLVPRVLGDDRNSLYVDGISVYTLDSKSGKIDEHSIENFLINNTPITPPHGILSALRKELLQPSEQLVPAGACYSENEKFC